MSINVHTRIHTCVSPRHPCRRPAVPKRVFSYCAFVVYLFLLPYLYFCLCKLGICGLGLREIGVVDSPFVCVRFMLASFACICELCVCACELLVYSLV